MTNFISDDLPGSAAAALEEDEFTLSEEELQIFNSILEEEEKGTRPRKKSAQTGKTPTPALNRKFWDKAKKISTITSKTAISIRLDAEMLDWFKQQGDRYQSRMNAVLRAYMDSQTKR